MNLLQLLLGSLTSESSVNSLVKKTGISSKLISKLIVMAVPLLIRYMTKNASSQSGAQSLLSALTQHTNKRSMAEQIDEVDEEDGNKIIGHILGDDKEKVVNTLAGETGLGAEDVNKGLGALAPALLTGLSAATTSASQSNGSLDLGDLMSMFGGSQSQATNSLGLLGSLLGGGAQQTQSNAVGLLGSLFGGAPQQQQQSSGGLLGSLFGSKEEEKPQPQTTGITDLFGSLLGSGTTQQQQQAAFDGSDLLNALTALMK